MTWCGERSPSSTTSKSGSGWRPSWTGATPSRRICAAAWRRWNRAPDVRTLCPTGSADVFERLSGKGRLSEEDVEPASARCASRSSKPTSRSRSSRQFVAAFKRGRRPGRAASPHPGRSRSSRSSTTSSSRCSAAASRKIRSAAAADGHHARRPAGLGQDDDRRQARALQSARWATSRCWSPRTSYRPAAVEQLQTLGKTDRRAGLP